MECRGPTHEPCLFVVILRAWAHLSACPASTAVVQNGGVGGNGVNPVTYRFSLLFSAIDLRLRLWTGPQGTPVLHHTNSYPISHFGIFYTLLSPTQESGPQRANKHSKQIGPIVWTCTRCWVVTIPVACSTDCNPLPPQEMSLPLKGVKHLIQTAAI